MPLRQRSYSVVVITSALHAEGPQFDPGWEQLETPNNVSVLHTWHSILLQHVNSTISNRMPPFLCHIEKDNETIWHNMNGPRQRVGAFSALSDHRWLAVATHSIMGLCQLSWSSVGSLLPRTRVRVLSLLPSHHIYARIKGESGGEKMT